MMAVRDIRLEKCRKYLRTQNEADARAGLFVRKTVFDLIKDIELHPQANVFMACLGNFDRALAEGASGFTIETARQAAIQAFDDLVDSFRDEQVEQAVRSRSEMPTR